jgi:hypothetical protein
MSTGVEFGHNKVHDIDSTSDHNGVSGATADNLVSFDANGLPKDALVASSNVKKGNYTATAIPIPDNDDTEGYVKGSPWWYGEARKLFVCMDATTGSAKWEMIFSNGNVKNVSGDTINRGTLVYYNGAQGSKPTIAKAKADAEATSSGVVGFILDNILDNGDGFVVTEGIVTRVDTNLYAAGTTLFLSADTAGAYTNIPPTSPNHLTIVGKVLYQHSEQGIIQVTIQNGWETTELHNWDETPATTNGQTPMWDNDNSKYIVSDAMLDSKDTGSVSWTGSGDYYDEAFVGGTFNLERGGTGRESGVLVPFSDTQSTTTFAANTTSYIYIDSSGLIQKTTTRTHALFEDNIVLFEVMYDGTNYDVIREDHPYKMDVASSNELHDIAGTVFEPGTGVLDRVTTGTGSVTTDRQLKQVGDVEIHDHGIESELLDSSGAGVVFRHKYTNASGKWLQDSSSATFPMKYNNAGTPTSITTNRFGVFRLYLSKDDLNTSSAKLFSIMHTSEYTTLTQAQTAIANGDIVDISNELAALEMAQYGYVIVKNTAAGGHVQEIIIEKSILGGQTLSGGTSNQASLITTDVTNYGDFLPVTDTNLQAVTETVNSLGASIAETDTGIALNKAVTPDGLAGSDFGIKYVQIIVTDYTTDVSTGDGKAYFHIPAGLDGFNLVEVHAEVITAGTTGTHDIQLYNVTQTADMLSTKITIDSTETGSDTAATPAVIDTANDDVSENDLIRVDVDAVQTTAAKGQIVTLGFRKP